ncbi:RNA polymerase sigma factor [Actinosynnema sp. CS-041913]|uniref:RNA polymerase sigma factor n=1 Tax=Actinosynnema sp. CS-041913 TaxID=3239917 RepID=UPI003D8C35D8
MTNVLDRQLTAVPAQPPAARTRVAGFPEPLLDEDQVADLLARPGSPSDADRALLEALRTEDFHGPAYRLLIDRLASYTLPVITAFIRTRQIFQESANHGRHVAVPPWFVPEDADELAAETVAEGLALLQKQLRGGRWNPDHGASLTTYAIGACIRSFPNVFRRYERFHGSWLEHTHASGVAADDFPQRWSAIRSAEDTVMAKHSISSALADLSEVKLQVLFLSAEEVPQWEIAQQLGLTIRAVEGQLRRARAELRASLDRESRRSPDIKCADCNRKRPSSR